VLRVARDEKAVMAVKDLAESGEAVVYRFYRVIFIIDTLRP
jgi:hypothetical protein